MKLLPNALQFLVNELSRLPGVGERTALRYAVSLLRSGPLRQKELEKALQRLREEVEFCDRCFFWKSQGHCPLCEDLYRPQNRICVVRDCPDVLALERHRKHPWTYHVLGGLLSPLNGRGPREIRFQELFRRMSEDFKKIEEVILALDATLEGDATALFVKGELRAAFPALKISRTALGLPAGASVEYLDSTTLEQALAHRTDLE